MALAHPLNWRCQVGCTSTGALPYDSSTETAKYCVCGKVITAARLSACVCRDRRIVLGAVSGACLTLLLTPKDESMKPVWRGAEVCSQRSTCPKWSTSVASVMGEVKSVGWSCFGRLGFIESSWIGTVQRFRGDPRGKLAPLPHGTSPSNWAQEPLRSAVTSGHGRYVRHDHANRPRDRSGIFLGLPSNAVKIAGQVVR